ncbi:UNVERIFIED_CONTAM: hypothetical protein GTU68_045260 [Idotea baltica]|nr:hypothetical protein [Idotea baltica]
MHGFIITGTSRGIGAALSQKILTNSHSLIGISRSENSTLNQLAEDGQNDFIFCSLDLGRPETATNAFVEVFSKWLEKPWESLTFIHNAGALKPVTPVGTASDLSEITHAMNVNVTTPMLLTEHFIAKTQALEIEKRLLFISSGAALKGREGWGTYCSSKAAINMYAECIFLEQTQETYPIKVTALAPGVVDTSMQDLLRDLPEAQFPSVGRFISLKKENKLWSPEYVAERILELMEGDELWAKPSGDLRNME